MEVGGLSLCFCSAHQAARPGTLTCSLGSRRSRPQPQSPALRCHLSKAEQHVLLTSKSPDVSPSGAATFFRMEFLTWCVVCFFKNTPTASKNLSRGRETFLVELLLFEMVSNYAPLSWSRYTTLSTYCFCGEAARWQSVDRV